jgi:pentatricopeptide repeat protein
MAPETTSDSSLLRTPEQCDDQLANYIRHNDWEGVLQTLRIMQQLGFVQTEQTFFKCLQACTSSSNTNSTSTDLSLLVDVWNALKQTVEPTQMHVEYILQQCCRTPPSLSRGDDDDDDDNNNVWSLLRQSSQTHNHAIQVLCRRGQWKWALREWKILQQQLFADSINSTSSKATQPETYHALWNVCIQAKDCPIQTLLSLLQAAEAILTAMDVLELLQIIAPQQSWRNVWALWEFLRQHHAAKLSLECYHAILFHRHVPLTTAQALLRDLQRTQSPTIETYNRVMYLAQRERQIAFVLQLLQELQQKYNLTPNVVTYTHVVRACLQDRQWKRALVVFEVAQDKLGLLDVYLYTAAMEACVALKQSRQALQLLDEMKQQKIAPNSFTYRVAMQAAPHRALEFLHALKATSDDASIPLITYNAALQALAQTAKQQAKEPNVVTTTTNTTTSANTNTPIWQHAVNLLEEIKEQNLQPDGFTYNAVIMCCCHGPWELALQFIQEMQDSSQPPNRLVYTAAIASCGKHGQADHALRLLAQMKQHKIQPDLITYNAVFTALRVAHRPEQAWQLWKELLEQGTTQPKTLLLTRTAEAGVLKRQYSTGKASLVPDIITITEVIGALAGTDESEDYQAHVDGILAYAVERKLLLNGFLDSSNEINLSGLTFPVARAACRYLLQNYEHVDNQELTLITGVGKQSNKTSLRDYLQEWLEQEFGLKTSIPRFAQGTLVISSESLLRRASRS